MIILRKVVTWLQGLINKLADQIGCQSGARIGVHNHLSISQGGIIYWAYRCASRLGALAVNVANDAQTNLLGGLAYELLKEITVVTAQAGTFRISWDSKDGDNITEVHSRFYVNDVAVSAVKNNNTNVWANHTHNYDFNLVAGDRLQIWGNPEGDNVLIRNFRILYDWTIPRFTGDGTSRVLVTPLALTDVDLLDVINTMV